MVSLSCGPLPSCLGTATVLLEAAVWLWLELLMYTRAVYQHPLQEAAGQAGPAVAQAVSCLPKFS